MLMSHAVERGSSAKKNEDALNFEILFKRTGFLVKKKMLLQLLINVIS